MTSRVSGAARDAGVELRAVRDADSLRGALEHSDVKLVMIDMSLPLEVAMAAIRTASSHTTRPNTTAFYSHVQSELREAAVNAGAQQAIARSKFVEVLPQLLLQHCT